MSTERFIDDEGILNVVTKMDIPISAMKYLKWAPGLAVLLVLILLCNLFICIKLCDVAKRDLCYFCGAPENPKSLPKKGK